MAVFIDKGDFGDNYYYGHPYHGKLTPYIHYLPFAESAQVSKTELYPWGEPCTKQVWFDTLTKTNPDVMERIITSGDNIMAIFHTSVVGRFTTTEVVGKSKIVVVKAYGTKASATELKEMTFEKYNAMLTYEAWPIIKKAAEHYLAGNRPTTTKPFDQPNFDKAINTIVEKLPDFLADRNTKITPFKKGQYKGIEVTREQIYMRDDDGMGIPFAALNGANLKRGGNEELRVACKRAVNIQHNVIRVLTEGGKEKRPRLPRMFKPMHLIDKMQKERGAHERMEAAEQMKKEAEAKKEAKEAEAKKKAEQEEGPAEVV